MPFGLDKPVANVVGVPPSVLSRITFPSFVSRMSPVAARKVFAPNGNAASAAAASRERRKVVLVMVCFLKCPAMSRARAARQHSNTGNVKNPAICSSLRDALREPRELLKKLHVTYINRAFRLCGYAQSVRILAVDRNRCLTP